MPVMIGQTDISQNNSQDKVMATVSSVSKTEAIYVQNMDVPKKEDNVELTGDDNDYIIYDFSDSYSFPNEEQKVEETKQNQIMEEQHHVISKFESKNPDESKNDKTNEEDLQVSSTFEEANSSKVVLSSISDIGKIQLKGGSRNDGNGPNLDRGSPNNTHLSSFAKSQGKYKFMIETEWPFPEHKNAAHLIKNAANMRKILKNAVK
uniref:RAP domain-containing protein n=1 Tax=Meloidogyne hapla TaxID=6305 RepID=A0A1I8BFU1_MELHA